MPAINQTTMGPSVLTSEALIELLQLRLLLQQKGYAVEGSQVKNESTIAEFNGEAAWQEGYDNGMSQMMGGIGQLSGAVVGGGFDAGSRIKANLKFNEPISNQTRIIENAQNRLDYMKTNPEHLALQRNPPAGAVPGREDVESILAKVRDPKSAPFNAKAVGAAQTADHRAINALTPEEKATLKTELQSTLKEARKEKTSLEGQRSDYISNWSRVGSLLKDGISGCFQMGAGGYTIDAAAQKQIETLLGAASSLLSKAQDTTSNIINTAQQAQLSDIRNLGGEGMKEYRG